MWKFVTGAKAPAPKKEKNYELNRKPRTFRNEWLENRPWLRFCQESEAMFCDVCQTAGKQSEFTKGCKSFRVETVKIHEKSEAHRHAEEIKLNKEKKVGCSVIV